ncbi:uncharacterized protein LOC121982268 isoform X1 [Zingiber officinale]|uniref:uncharacterized protein LOC121982268 isoform X1 n=1 Tax=Zingiber officinale TaxID=94328 RepID=UPI001C4BD307|nr:uncharacterized protein LOC121982268 isoform X1 [Zingiber officinale]
MENGKKNSSTSPEEAHCRRHTDGPPGTPPASSRPSTSPGGKMGRTICDHQDLVLRQLPLRPPLHREREAQRRLPDSCLGNLIHASRSWTCSVFEIILGEFNLSVLKSRDRRRCHRGGRQGGLVQGGRSRRRGLHGQLLPQLPRVRAAPRELLPSDGLDLQRHRSRRHHHLRRLLRLRCGGGDLRGAVPSWWWSTSWRCT